MSGCLDFLRKINNTNAVTTDHGYNAHIAQQTVQQTIQAQAEQACALRMRLPLSVAQTRLTSACYSNEPAPAETQVRPQTQKGLGAQ